MSDLPSFRWSRDDVAELLVSRAGLTGLTHPDALQIVQRMTPKRFENGTILIQEGVASNSGYMGLVLRGEAVVESGMRGHPEAMVLSILTQGMVFGEVSLFDGKPRSASVKATSELDVAVLDRTAFATLLAEAPHAACSLLAAIMVSLSERLRVTNGKVRTLTAINRSLLEELETRKSHVRPVPPAGPGS